MHAELRKATVRPWRKSDATSLARHANDRAIWLNLRDGFPHPYTLQDAHAFLSRAPETFFCIAVDDEAVGGIGLMPGDDVERFSAELGYWLGVVHHGKGIVTEAIAAVTTHALGTLDLKRVFALPYAENRASQRVLDKNGYVNEGRLRASAFKDGRFVDQVLYARVRDAGDVPANHALTVLAVDDLPRAVAFYDAAIGWEHAVDVPVYVELSHPNGQRLGLYQREGYGRSTGVVPTAIADDDVSSAELYFRVLDLERAIARMEAAGARVLSPRARRDWGDEAAYFRDPFGHVLVVARE